MKALLVMTLRAMPKRLQNGLAELAMISCSLSQTKSQHRASFQDYDATALH